jgi:hypothetical protein
VVALAEAGRRRGAGRTVFGASISLLAPVWVLERGVCAWLAVLQRLRFGGVRYGDSVIPVAAHSRRRLRQLAATRNCVTESSAAPSVSAPAHTGRTIAGSEPRGG